MKRIVLMLALCGQPFCSSSASFQNLGFDTATTNGLTCSPGFPPFGPTCFGTTSELLPGWELSSGPLLSFNLTPSGLGVASLYKSGPVSPALNLFPTMGIYSLGLWPGNDLVTQAFVPQILMQTGDLPANANSIRFLNYGSPFELRVNNNVVPLSYEYFTFPDNPTLPVANVAGDISAYAGRNVELRFTTLKIPFQSLNGIDSIVFSTEPVPEPDVALLLSAGLLAMIGAKWLTRIRK